MNGREPLDARVWPDAADPAITHIDVRGLPPPQPMVQILALVQRLPRHATLMVHHERDPLWLYPELLELGWWADVVDGEPCEVRLRIVRSDPTP
jgi:Uncharacterized conserved protein (DUF2249)